MMPTNADAPKTSDTMPEPMLRLHVQNAVLRIAARHHNLLQRQVFDELSEVVARCTAVRTSAAPPRSWSTRSRPCRTSWATPKRASAPG